MADLCTHECTRNCGPRSRHHTRATQQIATQTAEMRKGVSIVNGRGVVNQSINQAIGYLR